MNCATITERRGSLIDSNTMKKEAFPLTPPAFDREALQTPSPSGADFVPADFFSDDELDSDSPAITVSIDSTKCPRSQSPIIFVDAPSSPASVVSAVSASSPNPSSSSADETLWRTPGSPAIMFQSKQYIKGWFGHPFTSSLLQKLNFSPLHDSVGSNWSLWSLTGTEKIDNDQLKKMKTWQRFGGFPGQDHLTKKDKLWASVNYMMSKHGDSFNFVPTSFVIPKQQKDFRKECSKVSGDGKANGPWIVKPVKDGCASEIKITDNVKDISKQSGSLLNLKKKKSIVSKYINNPLLIDGHKFDLRFFVLVTSFDPLRVYFFNDGIACFSTESYDVESFSTNPFAHVTSTSVNSKNAQYVASNDANETNYGHTRSAKAVMEILKRNNVNSNKLMRRIHDVAIKLLIGAQDMINEQSLKYIPYRRNCYQLFGLEVIVDDKLKPWVVDFKANPSLEPLCLMEAPMKGKVTVDMLRTLGLLNEQMPQRMNVPTSLSEADTIDVVCTLTENKNSGNFDMIYPAPNFARYDKFMTNPHSEANKVIVDNLWPSQNRDSDSYTPMRTPSTFFRMYPTPVPNVPSPVLPATAELRQSTFFRMYPVLEL